MRTEAIVAPVEHASSINRTRLASRGGGPIHRVTPLPRSQPITNNGNPSIEDAIVAGTKPPRAMPATTSGAHSETRSSNEATSRSA